MVISLKQYITLFTVQLCTAFSVAMLSVSLISIVHNHSGSVSLLMLSMALPAILFSRTIGGLFDKYKNKGLMIFAMLFQLFLVASMLLGDLFACNIFIYLFAFFTFTVHIFIDLLLQIRVTHIAKEAHYLTFNSILSLVENIGIITGPILGGYFVYRDNLHAGFIAIFAIYALIFILTFFLEIPKSAACEGAASKDGPGWEGSERTLKRRIKQIFYAAALFGFGISIINVMQISFVISRYHTNALGFGLTESAWGAGMAIGAFILLLLYKRFRHSSIFGYGYIVIGAAIFALVVSPNFYFALFLFLLIGIGNSIVSIVSTTLIQLAAPPAMLGKSLGMKSMFFQISSLFAMTITGFLEWTVSPVALFTAAGVIFLLSGKFILLQVLLRRPV